MKQSFISLSNTIVRELDFTNELNLFHQVSYLQVNRKFEETI